MCCCDECVYFFCFSSQQEKVKAQKNKNKNSKTYVITWDECYSSTKTQTWTEDSSWSVTVRKSGPYLKWQTGDSGFTGFHNTLTAQMSAVTSCGRNKPGENRHMDRSIMPRRTAASSQQTPTCHCQHSWSQGGCVWSWSCGPAWVDSWCVLSSPLAVDLESPDRERHRDREASLQVSDMSITKQILTVGKNNAI